MIKRIWENRVLYLKAFAILIVMETIALSLGIFITDMVLDQGPYAIIAAIFTGWSIVIWAIELVLIRAWIKYKREDAELQKRINRAWAEIEKEKKQGREKNGT